MSSSPLVERGRRLLFNLAVPSPYSDSGTGPLFVRSWLTVRPLQLQLLLSFFVHIVNLFVRMLSQILNGLGDGNIDLHGQRFVHSLAFAVGAWTGSYHGTEESDICKHSTLQ